MKIALCFHGYFLNSGGDQAAFASWEYLRRKIMNGNDVDVFFHCWEQGLGREMKRVGYYLRMILSSSMRMFPRLKSPILRSMEIIEPFLISVCVIWSSWLGQNYLSRISISQNFFTRVFKLLHYF